MIVILIGPMGCGKTTVGRQLAQHLRCRFDDADDFHSFSNVEKMRVGVPLNDDDRLGWLKKLRQRIEDRVSAGENLVLACSALKRSYRKILGVDQKTVITVYLEGAPALLEKRISGREHAYMNKGLLASQLAAMERPHGGIVVDIELSPEQICRRILRGLQYLDR